MQAAVANPAVILVGQTLNYDISGTCTDADGDTVTQSAVTNGESEITNGWMNFAANTFGGVPDVAGTYTMEVRCSDGMHTDSVTFDIVVDPNSPPVYTDLGTIVFEEGETMSISSAAAWTDPDSSFTCTMD